MHHICTSQLANWVTLVMTYNTSSKLKTKRENHWALHIVWVTKGCNDMKIIFGVYKLHSHMVAFAVNYGQLGQLTHHWSRNIAIAWEQRPYRSKLNSINKSKGVHLIKRINETNKEVKKVYLIRGIFTKTKRHINDSCMRFINVAVTNSYLAISISCQTKNFKSHHLIKEVVKRKRGNCNFSSLNYYYYRSTTLNSNMFFLFFSRDE